MLNMMSSNIAIANFVADNSWYLDLRATHHFIPDYSKLTSATPFTGSDQVTVGDGRNYISRHVVFNELSFLFSNIQSPSPCTICPYFPITIPIFPSSTTHISPSISNFTPTPLSSSSLLPSSLSISPSVRCSDSPTTATSLPPPPQPSTFSTILDFRLNHLLTARPSNMLTDGCIDRYKARLVAKGYHQTDGLDFFETFSPVVKPVTIRVLVLSLGHHFAIKDLRPLHYFLVIKVHRSTSGLHLSQHKYITDLLACTSMTDSKSVHSPMASGSALSIHDGTPLEDGTTYRSVVGALQYCTLTRPNISFVVNKVCQFMHSPSNVHWQAIKRILHYLKGTSHYGLSIQATPVYNLTCFSYIPSHLSHCN
ncbi:hypothetical protein AAG906_009322 [Vitis piasezkii]